MRLDYLKICAAILLASCTSLQADCRCKFALLKHQLKDMYTDKFSDFQNVASFVEGLKTLDDLLFENEENFAGQCRTIKRCNSSILHDLLAVNLLLQTSAGRSALAPLPRLSSAVKIIETNFYYFDNYIKELAKLRPGHAEFEFEFRQDRERLSDAMKSVCFVSEQTDNATRLPSFTLKQMMRWNRCSPMDYLPMCFKLHSASMQYLMMLQFYTYLSDTGSIRQLRNQKEFAYYRRFQGQLIEAIELCRVKSVKNVEKSEKQYKIEYLATGISGVLVVLLIIILAVILAIWMSTRGPSRATFDRVVTNSDGYEYETGYV